MEIKLLPLGQSPSDKHRAAELKWRGMPPGIPPAMAIEFMAKLKAGGTIGRLTTGKYGPSMVSYDRFKKHCSMHPEWAAEARQISNINGNFCKGSRVRNRTHCKHGHPLFGENLQLYNNGKFRRCRTCAKKNESSNRKMSEGQARLVVEALQEGKTIADITGGGKPTYILNHRALLLFRRSHPKFERVVLRLSAANAKIHHVEASARIARRHRASVIAERGADIFLLIRSAVPTSLPAQIRDDVIAVMALEFVEGKLHPSKVHHRVREYISAQFKAFTTFGRVSLDAQLYDDGSATLLDRLSTEAGTDYWDVNRMASTGRRK